jgi:hypothetical protein
MGFVTDDATGHPSDGAQVTLTGPVVRTVTADATGFFGAVDLPAGAYTVTARRFDGGTSAPGRSATVSRAEVAQVSLVLGAAPVTVVEVQAGTPVVLTWTSRPDRTYTVEASDDLRAWTVLVTALPSAGATTTYRDFTAFGRERRYYRIVEMVSAP